MNIGSFWLGLVIGSISSGLFGQWVFSAAGKGMDSPKCVSPGLVAEYVHSVIEADRTFYQTEIVDRLSSRGVVFASEHWKTGGDLPLPAQFLLETGRRVAKRPHGIRYRLISNWAINKQNGPRTEFERTGLSKILANPTRPYTGITTEGKTRVFQALYADKAVSSKCADCHNLHLNSPKGDFKLGDVMGGVLLTIPLP